MYYDIFSILEVEEWSNNVHCSQNWTNGIKRLFSQVERYLEIFLDVNLRTCAYIVALHYLPFLQRISSIHYLRKTSKLKDVFL